MADPATDLPDLLAQVADTMAATADDLGSLHAKVASLQADKDDLTQKLAAATTELKAAQGQLETVKKASVSLPADFKLDVVLKHAERAGLLSQTEKAAAASLIANDPVTGLTVLAEQMAASLPTKEASQQGKPFKRATDDKKPSSAEQPEIWCSRQAQAATL